VARFLDSRRPSGWGPWGRFPVAGRAGPGSRFGDQWLLLTRRRSIMRLNAGRRKTAPGSRVSPAPPFLTSPAPRKPPRKVRLPHLAPRYWLVRQTLRWRETDSNLYGAFPVKRLFFGCANSFLFGAGKAVFRPVACNQVRGVRGRGQGTETVAKLGGLPPSGACVSQRLDA
jgi:hypothetical protein